MNEDVADGVAVVDGDASNGSGDVEVNQETVVGSSKVKEVYSDEDDSWGDWGSIGWKGESESMQWCPDCNSEGRLHSSWENYPDTGFPEQKWEESGEDKEVADVAEES